MSDKFKTLVLQSPVEYGDTLITELKLRRPRGKNLRRLNLEELENAGLDIMMNLVADLSGQPPQVIDLLEMEDVFAAVEMVGGFFEKIGRSLTGQ